MRAGPFVTEVMRRVSFVVLFFLHYAKPVIWRDNRSVNTLIAHEYKDTDAWICICGNTTSSGGFGPVDESNHIVEPAEETWRTGHYICVECGRVIDPDTLAVVRVVNVKDIIYMWPDGFPQ